MWGSISLLEALHCEDPPQEGEEWIYTAHHPSVFFFFFFLGGGGGGGEGGVNVDIQ